MWLQIVDVYRPPWPPWLIGGLVAVAAIAAMMLYGRAARHGHGGRAATLTALRFAALAGVAWVLAGPSVMSAVTPAERQPRVSMLVDTSKSMTERDASVHGEKAGEAITRWDAIAQHWLDPGFLRELDQHAQLELLGFDQTLHRLEPAQAAAHEPDGQATHLFAALERAVTATHAPDVAVLLSDGRDTRDAMSDRLLERLAQSGARVFTVPVGQPHAGAHLALEAWPEADVLHAGESTTVHASVSQHGHDEGEVTVALYHKGERIDERSITFDAGRAAARVRFEVTPTGPGPRSVVMREYELRVEPTDADAPDARDDGSFEDRHSDRVFVQVSRERMRVALLEGKPYWDTRFLARVLRRDRRVALHTVHVLGDDRRLHLTDEAGKPLPVDALDADVLGRFDVVILGKGAERFFPGERAALLTDYVERRGGALVLARGRPFDVSTEAGRRAMAQIEPIAPVTWGEGELRRLRVALTPEGGRSPLLAFEDAADALGDEQDAVLSNWPEMIAATRIESTRAASAVLLRQAVAGETPTMAALVHTRAGRGRVLAVLSDGLWRWALLAERERAERGVYELLWRRAVRWLAADGEFLPGQDVALTLDRTVAEPDEPVNVTVATRHVPEAFEPALTRIDPDGERQRVRLERADESATHWRATVRAATAGVHRLELQSAGQPALIPADTPIVAHLAVRRWSIEALDTAARPDVLETLAEHTGGDVLRRDDTERLLEYIRGVATARSGAGEPRDAFARWPAFVMIALCLGLEWLLRRRSGWL